METFDFLCDNYENINFVYAIRSDSSDWHYFEEGDSSLDAHVSLRPSFLSQISLLINKVKPITLILNADQILNYVKNGKFVFKGKELKTCKLSLLNKTTVFRFLFKFFPIRHTIIRHICERSSQCIESRHQPQSTHDLVFKAGESNPANFLKKFEKCLDVKTEKDKLYKLRNFVNEDDKTEFSTLYFKGDWQKARLTFLRKYSMEFTKNRKRDLDFNFENETSLRSFVARKMNALSTYTTLSVENQLEVILPQLPNEIANIFIEEDKTYSSKNEILEFCDVIQEVCENTHNDETSSRTTSTSNTDLLSNIAQELEIFDFQKSLSYTGSTSSTSTNSSGRGKKKRFSRSGRPAKIPRTISEEVETSTGSESDE